MDNSNTIAVERLANLEENLTKIEKAVARIERALPIIDALGSILVRRTAAAKQIGVTPQALDQNEGVDKFKEYGHKRTFIEIGDVRVIKRRSRGKAKV